MTSRQLPLVIPASPAYDEVSFIAAPSNEAARTWLGRTEVWPDRRLALWGEAGIPAAGASPLDIWKAWAKDVRGHSIKGGHFLPEESPEPTLAALIEFFS